jgi:hypothetical protein
MKVRTTVEPRNDLRLACRARDERLGRRLLDRRLARLPDAFEECVVADDDERSVDDVARLQRIELGLRPEPVRHRHRRHQPFDLAVLDHGFLAIERDRLHLAVKLVGVSIARAGTAQDVGDGEHGGKDDRETGDQQPAELHRI